ncbi:MAG: hypothetical protein H7836_10875 [Magnetococcus sp. YQC-3]
MPTRTTTASKGSFVLLLLLLLGWVGAVAAEPLKIGRMRVAVWPEYDDSGVLLVYDGRFADNQSFPARTRFFLPKGILISDACSLSPEGQHFCQLFKVEAKEQWDEVELWLPFANFYLSVHLPPLQSGAGERLFDYTLKTNHPVELLELDIQQPLRSTGFAIEPSGGQESVRNGFTHWRYALHNLLQGEERRFRIRYHKTDATPSVDIKFSATAMTGEKVFGSPYETQRRAGLFVYALFGSGLFFLLGGIVWWVRNRRRGR